MNAADPKAYEMWRRGIERDIRGLEAALRDEPKPQTRIAWIMHYRRVNKLRERRALLRRGPRVPQSERVNA